MHPKEAMETRERSPDCVHYHSQPPTATENIFTLAVPTLDPSSCRTSLYKLGRETPITYPSACAHPQGSNTPIHLAKLL